MVAGLLRHCALLGLLPHRLPLLSLLCWLLFVLPPPFLSAYSLGELIQSQCFKNHLHADAFPINISSLGLSLELQMCQGELQIRSETDSRYQLAPPSTLSSVDGNSAFAAAKLKILGVIFTPLFLYTSCLIYCQICCLKLQNISRSRPLLTTFTSHLCHVGPSHCLLWLAVQ